MKTLIIVLVFIGIIGMFSPVYGLNFLHEEERKVKVVIDMCTEEIENSELTFAEKEVAKRNCVTQIHNYYVEFTNDHNEIAKWKSNVQDIQKCGDWYQEYIYLDYEQFIIKKTVDLIPYCVSLYESDVWNYDGSDRTSVLVSALDEMKTNTFSDETFRYTEIPDWVRYNAEWWYDGQITDYDFALGVQYLIEQKIIKISENSSKSMVSSYEIPPWIENDANWWSQVPPWIKNNANWWSQGVISDKEFSVGIQFMIEQGIIKI